MSTFRLLDCQPGDVLATAGTENILPPWPTFWYPRGDEWRNFKRQLVKRQLYKFIRRYQWNEGHMKNWPTHVSACIGYGVFFEMTDPVGRVGKLDELVGRKVAVCRPLLPFDVNCFVDSLLELEGVPYDRMELLALLIDQTLKIKLAGRGILDKYHRYVCSTALGNSFVKSGFDIPIEHRPRQISPAYYNNRPERFGVEFLVSAML